MSTTYFFIFLLKNKIFHKDGTATVFEYVLLPSMNRMTKFCLNNKSKATLELIRKITCPRDQ